jgi:hypothetical protein
MPSDVIYCFRNTLAKMCDPDLITPLDQTAEIQKIQGTEEQLSNTLRTQQVNPNVGYSVRQLA